MVIISSSRSALRSDFERTRLKMQQLWSSYVLLPKDTLPDTDNEDETKEDEPSDHGFINQRPSTTCNCDCNKRQNRHWTLLNLILSILGILIISTWINETFTKNGILKKSSYYCIDPLPSYSRSKPHSHLPAPILNRLTIPISTKQIHGSLFAPTNPSIGRAFPNAESDAIWEEIELPRTIVITADDVGRLGKDTETAVRFEDAVWGLGGDAFMGQIGECVL